MGWDPPPPQKTEVPPGWHAGGGEKAGGTPNSGVEMSRFGGAAPLREEPILGCSSQHFGAKKSDFGSGASHFGGRFYWGGCPNLGGGALSHFWVEKCYFG